MSLSDLLAPQQVDLSESTQLEMSICKGRAGVDLDSSNIRKPLLGNELTKLKGRGLQAGDSASA